MRFLARLCLAVCLLILSSVWNLHASFAQSTEDEKSRFVRFVEGQLSTPTAKISLNGLDGALSSNVSLDSITIADENGIWLSIEKPQLIWSRKALLVGELSVESLVAQKIVWTRQPLKDESLPAPEAGAFKLPDLPVAINIQKLDVTEISFGESVFGLAATTNLKGNMLLKDGSLDLALNAQRLDGPRGTFSIVAQYAKDTKNVNLDIDFQEPANGILANLLKIENRPPAELRIKGNAPLEDLTVAVNFDVAGQEILAGALELQETSSAIRALLNLGGPLAKILPANARSFFGQTSQIDSEVLIYNAGSIDISSFSLESGALSVRAEAKTLADGFLNALNLNVALQSQNGSPIELPFGEASSALQSANFKLDYDASNSEAWGGNLNIRDLNTAGTDISAINLKASGTATDIENTASRSVTFSVSGAMDGINSSDPAVVEAMGKTINVSGNGDWKSGTPLQLRQLTLSGKSFQLASVGSFANNSFTGAVRLIAKNLKSFAALTDSDLEGSATLRADGKITPLSGGFDIDLEGTGRNLRIGNKNIDPLLEGETTLTGTVFRTQHGLNFDGLRLANRQMNATVIGQLASSRANLSANAVIKSIATVTARGSGTAQLNANITGSQKPFDTRVEISMEDGQLQGRKVSGLGLTLSGLLDDKVFNGELQSRGTLDNRPVQLSGTVRATDEEQTIQRLLINVGGAEITGNLTRAHDGLLNGGLNIKARNIADLAALALVKATGAVNGDIELSNSNSKQQANADLTLQNIRVENARIASASLKAKARDLFNRPSVNAKIRAKSVRMSGINIRTLNGTVDTIDRETSFKVDTALAQYNAKIALRGKAQLQGAIQTITLDRLTVNSNLTSARLTVPTTIQLKNGVTSIAPTKLQIGSGNLTLQGSAGKQLNLDLAANGLPLTIINALQPGIGAAGRLTGKASVSGKEKNPQIDFDLNGTNVMAGALKSAGVKPMTISATGNFANNTLSLSRAQASNGQNISITAEGRIPIKGPGLSVSTSGTAPLVIAQGLLNSRGATIKGNSRFNLNLRGSVKNPITSGLLAVDNASLIDPLSNLSLVNIGLLAGISSDKITITKANAILANGGTISATGSVGLSGSLPANIVVNLNNARYTDGKTFNTTASGRLTVTGNLQADPTLGGVINLGQTEISVPKKFSSSSPLLKVEHVDPSSTTQATLKRIENVQPKGTPRSRPSVLRLNLAVNAPNQIFVRGRGLDAELGGQLKITGPVTNVQPVGGFQLRRGRVSLLGERLDLDQGIITLTGDLNPTIDISASIEADDIQAIVGISGRVADPQITFSSSPELPQDEILARILFGQGISELSATQIARLVSVASELSGGGSSLGDNVRKSTGLDDLDIVQDDKGETSAKVGKYISDKVYLGVQAGAKNEVSINLDITDNVKARGSVDGEGNTNLGIFLEKDY